MTTRATLANLLWFGSNVPAWRAFRAALSNATVAQETQLHNYLRANRGTAFGSRHGFDSIDSVAAFQARVPLSTYDEYEPWIDRIRDGQAQVLTAEPVRLLEPSSGSTRAAKFIPYTAALQREFRHAVGPWVVDLFQSDPSLLAGPAYWSISPAVPRDDRGAVPVGFDDDSAYLGGAFRHVVNAALAVPATVRHIADFDAFSRVTLLYLLRAADLRLVSVWHPTFLTLLMTRLEARWDGLLHDLARGHAVPGGGTIPPDPGRARALGSADPREPRSVWPHLRLISCWGDGHAEWHCAQLRRRFPGVPVQPKGLLATEGVVTIPFAGRKALAVTSHFFEFLDQSGGVFLPHQLVVGETYSPVLTTGGGLYRYRLQDLVRVTEFLGGAPCLHFLGKEDTISDRFGEKLSESFVAAALQRVFRDHDVAPDFALLAPETGADGAGYVLFVETRHRLPRTVETAVESVLQENPHYAYCVRTGQLQPVRVSCVPGDGYACYVTRLRAEGKRVGDIKPAALSGLTGWRECFGSEAPRRVTVPS